MVLNREVNYDSPSTAITQVLRDWSKDLHTAIPGIVDTYDASSRRARIRPALRMVMSGEVIGEDGAELERALAVNVPVLFPAGGGYTMLLPLRAGDRGMMIFSERGLTEFKRTGELSTPDIARFFDQSDAVFIPADFGHPAATPASTSGLCLQTHNGESAIILESDTITLKTSGTVVIESAGLTHNVTDVGDSHTHSGVTTGGGNTGTPT